MGQRLIIYGAARSGTTLLHTFVNHCEDCFILSESNVYQQYSIPGFKRSFQATSAKWNRTPDKGRYIPNIVSDDATGKEVLDALNEHFRIVGEKAACGPKKAIQDRFIEEISRHAFDATFILTLREPASNLVSMRKMFPHETDIEIYRAWATSLLNVLLIAFTFRKTYVVLHSCLSGDLLNLLGERLGISSRVLSDEAVGNIHINTPMPLLRHAQAGMRGEISEAKHQELPEDIAVLPPILRDNLELFHEAQSLFADISGSYDDRNFRLRYEQNLFEFKKDFIDRAQALLARVDGMRFLDSCLEHSAYETEMLSHEISWRFELNDFSPSTLELIRILIERFPENGQAFYFLAVYQHTKRTYPVGEILANYSKASGFGADPFWISYNRACLFFEHNMLDEARADIQIVRELAPRSPECAYLLEQARLRDLSL
ncbi:MAG: hypothetical protein JSR19_05755 [Proteobacteria bacterium]|nr:hypothetical protein [Pseudomonadota bacterium]HQR04680.1 hypothetical protein [Rhodocyclaceae bacterium]